MGWFAFHLIADILQVEDIKQAQVLAKDNFHGVIYSIVKYLLSGTLVLSTARLQLQLASMAECVENQTKAFDSPFYNHPNLS